MNLPAGVNFDAVRAHRAAGARDIHGLRGDAVDLGAFERRAGCETPGAVDKRAHGKTAARRIAQARNVAVANLHMLITHDAETDVGIRRSPRARGVKRALRLCLELHA